MISIALCDDEVKYLDYYENKIATICQDNNLMYDIIRFISGEALLFYLEDYPNKFDIIYLDILTGGMSGIETAKQIRKFNEKTKIIFLTNSDSYVFNSFETNPTDYLLKDIHESKFAETFLKTVSKINLKTNPEVYIFKSRGKEVTIPLNEIAFIESYQRQVIVNMYNKEKHEFYYKLSALTSELKPHNFVLIHRTYLVNLQYIKTLSRNEVTLKNGLTLIVSRPHYESLKNRYIEYLNGIKSD